MYDFLEFLLTPMHLAALGTFLGTLVTLYLKLRYTVPAAKAVLSAPPAAHPGEAGPAASDESTSGNSTGTRKAG